MRCETAAEYTLGFFAFEKGNWSKFYVLVAYSGNGEGV
jgi:hypothetical protein